MLDLLRSASARLWNVRESRPHCKPLRHNGIVNCVAFSPDGKMLATASEDLTVKFWDTATGQATGRQLQYHVSIESVAFSPDGKLLATAAQDGIVRLWELDTGLPAGPAFRHESFATSVAFSPDGKLLASGSFDKTARLWQLPARVDDPEEMQLRTEVALCARLNEQGLAASASSNAAVGPGLRCNALQR